MIDTYPGLCLLKYVAGERHLTTPGRLRRLGVLDRTDVASDWFRSVSELD
jgi:hypothetical protein